MADNKVMFEGILLKPAMVTPGAEAKKRENPETVAAYTLKIDLKQIRTPRGRRVDAAASRYELVLDAEWTLTEAATGVVAFKGVTSTEVTFDRADQPYASIAGHQDAEERAAAELARKIQLELAVWMARGRAG